MDFQPTAAPRVLTFRRLGGPEAPVAPEPVRSGPRLVVEVPPPEPAVDVEALVAEALARGRAEGRAEVEQEMAEERAVLTDTLDALSPALDELDRLRHETLCVAAEDVAALVLLYARRLVDRSLALHPDALPALVLESVAQLPSREQVSIAVAPHLAERLTRSLPADLRDRVVADTEIENGVVVRTHHVSIEATLAHATEGLEHAVRTWLSEQWWAVGDGEFG